MTSENICKGENGYLVRDKNICKGKMVVWWAAICVQKDLLKGKWLSGERSSEGRIILSIFSIMSSLDFWFVLSRERFGNRNFQINFAENYCSLIWKWKFPSKKKNRKSKSKSNKISHVHKNMFCNYVFFLNLNIKLRPVTMSQFFTGCESSGSSFFSKSGMGHFWD